MITLLLSDAIILCKVQIHFCVLVLWQCGCAILWPSELELVVRYTCYIHHPQATVVLQNADMRYPCTSEMTTDSPIIYYQMSICGKRLIRVSIWGYREERRTQTLYRFDTVSSGAGENAKLIYVN